MIAAVSFGNTAGDSPSVFVVDINKLTPVWRAQVLWRKAFEDWLDIDHRTRKGREPEEPPMADEWESLEAAQVPLPAMVDFAVHVYYDG